MNIVKNIKVMMLQVKIMSIMTSNMNNFSVFNIIHECASFQWQAFVSFIFSNIIIMKNINAITQTTERQ